MKSLRINFRFVLLTTIFICSMGYTGLLLLLYLRQDQLIFLPSPDLTDRPDSLGIAYEDLTLTTRDNEHLNAWLATPPNPRGTVIYLHGNGGNLSTFVKGVETFYKNGMRVLIIDYRGYGLSSGRPSEQGLYEDGETAWTYLTETLHIPPQQIVLYGISLGGGVATYLAEKYQPAGIILQSTYSSVAAVAADRYPYVPVDFLVRSRFNSLDRMPKIHIPVLIIHNRDDTFITPPNAERLFAAANEPKKLVFLEGGHGGAGPAFKAQQDQEIDDFLTSALKK